MNQTHAAFFQPDLRETTMEVAWASCPCLARFLAQACGSRFMNKVFTRLLLSRAGSNWQEETMKLPER
jgi:hypothetical protein